MHRCRGSESMCCDGGNAQRRPRISDPSPKRGRRLPACGTGPWTADFGHAQIRRKNQLCKLILCRISLNVGSRRVVGIGWARAYAAKAQRRTQNCIWNARAIPGFSRKSQLTHCLAKPPTAHFSARLGVPYPQWPSNLYRYGRPMSRGKKPPEDFSGRPGAHGRPLPTRADLYRQPSKWRCA